MRRRTGRPIQVRCPECSEWHNEQEVQFENIEEDPQGHDVLTFVCPSCQETVKSKRYGG